MNSKGLGLAVRALAVVVVLTVGGALTVYPQSHPRGSAGLLLDAVSEVLKTPVNDVEGSLQTNPPSGTAERGASSSDQRGSEQGDQISPASPVDLQSVRGDEWTLEFLSPPPIKEYWENEQKPVGFIEVEPASDRIWLVAGDGTGIWNYETERSAWSPIPHNLTEILGPEIRQPGKFSVKGLEVGANQIFVSASANRAIHGECYSTEVFVADFAEGGGLQFEEFFAGRDCVDPEVYKEANPHQSGGFLYLMDSSLLVGTGEYRAREKAQDPGSNLGAILRIPLQGPPKPEVLAIGLRNPQSGFVDGSQLWLTDQGPRGGDEVNQLDMEAEMVRELPNFGWPTASYGIHYDGDYRSEAPLGRPHDRFGFVEPAYFFSASIGISSIVIYGETGDVLVGGLGDSENMIEGDNSITILEKVNEDRLGWKDRVSIGHRVRDIDYLAENCFLVVLDSGNVAKLCSNED